MKKLSFLPRAALILALILVVWFLIAMFGAKFGLIDKMFAFGTMTVGVGGTASMVIAVLAIIALIVALVVKPRKGWGAALIALAIPVAVLAGFNQLRAQAGSVPFIYDITTNPGDAPTFSAAMMQARRAADANDLIPFDAKLGTLEKWANMDDVADKTAADLLAEGYPDLGTVTVAQSAEDAMTALEDAMNMRGFANVTADRTAGLVEGTDEVFWYGFQDDVVARVRATDSGTSIDFRSTSRLGLSDLGVNAQRIADLGRAVADRLAQDFPEVEIAQPDPGADDAVSAE